MKDISSEDLYYRGSDLMNKQRELLYHTVTQEINKQQWEIASILSSLQKNSQQYTQLQKTKESLIGHPEDVQQEADIQQKITTIHTTQHNLLLVLKPLFDDIFTQVASQAPWGIGYNAMLKDDVFHDVIGIFRQTSGTTDGSREHYRSSMISRFQEEKYKKQIQKNNEKRKQEKEKVRLPQDHRLLTPDTYPKFKETMWTYLDNVVSTYEQIFLKDSKSITQVQSLLDHHFLSIFLQTLIQSQMVFDIKKPKSTVFFQQVIDDCLLYLQKKYGVSLTISSDSIKKKFFTTIDDEFDTTKPMELIYKNSREEDILAREKYLDSYFFASNTTSVKKLYIEMWIQRKNNKKKLVNTFEIINPLYHIAKEKKEKIRKTVQILEKHQSEDTVIEDILKQLKGSLKKVEEDIKNNLVFEEDPIEEKDIESMRKLSQQYLKRYKVPVQYRKIFGIIINRYDNYYQIKTNLFKNAQENNNQKFDKLIYSEQKTKDIMEYIGWLITQKDLVKRLEEKWEQKSLHKFWKIQWLCNGTVNIKSLNKKKINLQWQTKLLL